MKKLSASLAILLAVGAAHAQVSPYKLQTDINNMFRPGRPGGFSSSDLNTVFTEMLGSAYLSVNPATGAISYFNGTAFVPFTAAQVGALSPTGSGATLTGITPSQVGAVNKAGDTMTGILNLYGPPSTDNNNSAPSTAWVKQFFPGLAAGTVPGVNPENGNIAGTGLSLTNPTLPWLMSANVTSQAGDPRDGTFLCSKNVNYDAGGPTSYIGTACLNAYTTVRGDNQNNQAALNGEIFNYSTQHGQPFGPQSNVGVIGQAFQEAAQGNPVWGLLGNALDQSETPDPIRYQIGAELGVYGYGGDANSLRIIALLAGHLGKNATSTLIADALRIVADPNVYYGNLFSTLGTVNAVNGLNLNGATFSGSAITAPGFSVDKAGSTNTKSLRLTMTNVASLPTCGPALDGVTYQVNDAQSAGYVLASSGGNKRLFATCDGANWYTH